MRGRGRNIWESVIADKSKGYANSSGPLIVHGKIIEGLGGCDRYKEDGACFISALGREDRQNALEVQHRGA